MSKFGGHSLSMFNIRAATNDHYLPQFINNFWEICFVYKMVGLQNTSITTCQSSDIFRSSKSLRLYESVLESHGWVKVEEYLIQVRYQTVGNYPLRAPEEPLDCRVSSASSWQAPLLIAAFSVAEAPLEWLSSLLCPHDYLWLCLGSFHPCTSNWGTPVQVGWNLHAFKTEERAAVRTLVKVFYVKTYQKIKTTAFRTISSVILPQKVLQQS